MLYWFYELLDINLLQYITVRAGVAFFLALCMTLFLMPVFIRWAQKTSSVQPINDYAPDRHREKAKTPTMGGVVFIVSTLIASAITVRYDNFFALGGMLVLALFMLIGFKDDYAKIDKQHNLAGLTARAKLMFQIGAALAGALFLRFAAGLDTELYVPFYKHPLFDMHLFALLFWVLVMVASSNAVNLTDGLDGLATVPSVFALMTLGVFVYVIGHAGLSAYLLMPNFPAGEASVVAAALIGALIGFLWFNSHPAEVFMGDSGSLAIGAFIGYLGIVAKSEFLLLLIGLIFVIETVSVIIQVGSFKLRKKRVFLMAPIHHHFEMKNWAENKIIVRFWIIAMLSNLAALITLKIR
ncbi:phospho-N-acetylmuramoyl-pentapeptide-transferase [Sulfurimonas sp. HSL-1656]|uniref:phospho-N-acetylmuramoyl-pentapeptide- transferase n=1 Tax=Thiomicrolovo subterrani TaxID=3131934 RepID=UPI0031F881D5